MMRKYLALLFAVAFSTSASADNVAFCEVLILQVITDQNLDGEAQVATYSPAVGYITSVYDDEDGHITHIAGQPIRALMCRRNDVIPAEIDYPLIATGIPFIISQDFDSPDTDSLTVYWKENAFEHVYKGYPLSVESQSILDERLVAFSKKGLNTITLKAQADKVASTSGNDDTLNSETNIDTNSDIKTEIEIVE